MALAASMQVRLGIISSDIGSRITYPEARERVTNAKKSGGDTRYEVEASG